MRCLALVLVLTLATSAFASDGVLEINQACATSVSGCFPGDSAGFPVTITQAGSYRLTGNLSTPSNTTAIQINTSYVTLDLGGFLVSGPNSCSGYPVTACTVTSGNPGIVSDQFLIVVQNGSVAGMGGACIQLNGTSSEVSHVRSLSCGGSGGLLGAAIVMGPAGRITNSFVGGSPSGGILLSDGGQAFDNEVRANGSYGIDCENTRLSTEIIGNRVFDNGGFGGISVKSGPSGGTGALVSRNVLSSNAASYGGFVITLGDNLCNGSKC